MGDSARSAAIEDFSLDGKVALVTGAGRGLGRSYALRLASLGAGVAICDLRLDAAHAIGETLAAESVVGEIEALGRPALGIEADVTDATAVGTVADHGRLDVLVNNAGVGTTEAIEEIDLDAIRRNFDVNFNGVVWGIKHAAAVMKPGSSIINIGSLGATYSLHGFTAYCASKAAVVSATSTAALELGSREIRVNAVCPGVVDTPMLNEPGTEAERAIALAISPLSRVAQPHEIAAAVHFLASDDAAFITGEALFVDGGVRTGAAQGVVDALTTSA